LGHQRTPRFEKVVRIEDGEPGLSARTIARRLSSVAGLFEYLIVRGDAGVEGIWSRAGWSPAGRVRAIVLAMLLGGLRRCEVLGVRLGDVNPGERRLFVASGKGGRERIVPVSRRFFEALGDYLQSERPHEVSTGAVFVVLKGPRRGLPLSAAGLDEVSDGAPQRAGVARIRDGSSGPRW
jgi:integrase/recombinase XerD